MALHVWILALQAALVWAQFNSPPSLPATLSRHFQVSEGAAIGDYIFTLKAVDNDANDVLKFSAITEETKNTVDLAPAIKQPNGTWTCELTLKTRLDRDRSPETKRLYFIVSDGSAEAQINIIMIIQDVNDNAPSFVGLPYKTSIPEDFNIDEIFFTVSATDPDLNSGGSVEYTIEANKQADIREYSETFQIQTFLGDIKLQKRLDYEERSFYHLKVYARDLGAEPCPGPTCVCEGSQEECDPGPVDLFITVEDVQDTPPVFERLLNMYTVPEDSPVGASILQIQASDGDRGVVTSNDVRYSFSDANPTPFSLDPVSGTISVATPLDVSDPRSTGGLYILSITATEVPPTGSPATTTVDSSRSTSHTNVSIIVTDVDDHAPEFNQGTYTATVLENTPSGAPITVSPAIVVSDMDQGENSRFRVSVRRNGLPYDGFTTLPGEEQIIQGSSSVTITVGDATVLDYEAGSNIEFQLILIEEHSGGSGPDPPRPTATATVVLELSDANDNSPVFPPNQPRSFSVAEDANPGHVIGTVTADDADSANFGTVTFSLEADGHDEEFNISAGGEITLAKEIDREVRSAYSLVVIATDSPGTPPSQQRSARLPIRVTVLDVNDLHPQWTQVIPVVSVQESASVGSKVTDLIAVDLDQGINGEIEYSIAPNTNGSSLFTVQKVDGRAELSVGSSLIGNSGVLLVKVKATDKGTQPLSSEAEVAVLVIDENQFDPVFTNPDESQYNVATGDLPEILVDEEQPINTELMQLQATDRDQGSNGEINYFLVPSLNKDFEFFTVDRETGFLRAARQLDRETKEVYEIQVKAEDLGKPAARASTLTMRVRLRDIDDHKPTFASQAMPFLMSVQEEDPTANIGVVSASDADSELSNRGVCYYLFGGDFLSRLTLNKDTGDLALQAMVDRETTQTFDVVIKASRRCDLDPLTFVSQGESPDTSETPSVTTPPTAYNATDPSLLWVRVRVRDVNDNSPLFSHQALSTGVLFDVPRETEVMDLALQVTDADSPDNSKHQFRLDSARAVLEEGDQAASPPETAFTVSANGTISTNTLFSSDLMGYYLLTVEVYDKDGRSDTADVRIYLISNLQRVKLIFNMRPNEVEKLKQEFVNGLSSILKINLVIDRVVSHTAPDGSKDGTRSDAYLHGWYQDTGEMVPAAELRRNLDFNQEIRALLYQYDVVEAQTIARASTDEDSDQLTRLFAIILAILGVLVIVLVLVLVHIVRMYRRRLRAATTMAYAAPKEQEMYEHPGTNKYYSAENPLYGREIKHAVIDDDKTSHNSLDVNAVDAARMLPPAQKTSSPTTSLSQQQPPPPQNEEQEVVMQISDATDNNNKTTTAATPNGEALPEKSKDDNHIATLDQVLQAYTNSAFQEEEENAENNENNDTTTPNNHIHSSGNNNNNNTPPNNSSNSNGYHKPTSQETLSPSNGGHPVRPSGVGLYIPGVGDNVQEGVTRFSDEILSSDSGYPDGVGNKGIQLDYTDI